MAVAELSLKSLHDKLLYYCSIWFIFELCLKLSKLRPLEHISEKMWAKKPYGLEKICEGVKTYKHKFCFLTSALIFLKHKCGCKNMPVCSLGQSEDMLRNGRIYKYIYDLTQLWCFLSALTQKLSWLQILYFFFLNLKTLPRSSINMKFQLSGN